VEDLTFPFAADSDADAGADAGAHHLAVVLLGGVVSRAQVQARLQQEGVQTSVHYPPIHRFSAYAGSASARRLPVTDAVAPRLLTLPLYPHLREDQVERVVDALKDAVGTRHVPRVA
jgi:dTDP-4-amino-4,6-dideoxygalactose transaminase